MNRKVMLLILIGVVILLTSNCSKETENFDQEDILGVWISNDKTDTLNFETESDFYKSDGYFFNDHYDYELFNDSILIEYSGAFYVYVTPTKQKFTIENDILKIDFSNVYCYGFPDEEITYIKEE